MTVTPRLQHLSAAALILMVFQPQAYSLVIYSNANDGFLESRGFGLNDLPGSGLETLFQIHPDTNGGFMANVGEWFNGSDFGLTVAVLPFQLPNFGVVSDPFATADLGVMVYERGSATATDADLYGVRVDPSPAISLDDWYVGTAPDPSATLIQEGFLSPTIPASPGFVGAPNVHTDATGAANLASYLNSAYDGGNNAGEYVFLRLNLASDQYMPDFQAYKLTVREAGQQGEWPVLNVTVNALPGDTNGNGIIEYPQDFDPILNNWRETNESFGALLARSDGDLNLDGVVSIGDFREWKNAYLALGGSAALVSEAVAALGGNYVPEPASLGLLLVAVAGLAGCRRGRA